MPRHSFQAPTPLADRACVMLRKDPAKRFVWVKNSQMDQQLRPLLRTHHLGSRLARWAWVTGLMAAMLFSSAFAAPAAQPQPPLPQQQLTLGMHVITVEVARTPQAQEMGLMHRTSLPANQGMLFVFEQKQTACFWMKNTRIPLSLAFLDDDGTILQLTDMTPHSLQAHCSNRPVRLALEMNRGWFRNKKIQVGQRFTFPRPGEL
jgi:uncharacterized membrane protein (UPF0127 family)